jgi:hypothetical protein
MTTGPLPPRPPASARPFVFAWMLYSAALLLGVRFLSPAGLVEHMEFRQLYVAGYLVRTDPANLYDYERQREVEDDHVSQATELLPFVRPPYEAWLFGPLSRLPYPTAYFVFAAFNLALVALCFFLCRGALARPGTVAQPRAGLQMFVFLPVTIAVRQGHDSLILLAGLCLVWRLLAAKKRLLAGGVLALLLFKLELCLPLAVLLAAYYGARFLGGFFAGALLATLASLAAAGVGGLRSFALGIGALGRLTLAETGPYGTFGALPLEMPNLKGLVTAATRDLLPGRAVFLVVAAVSAGLALWALRTLRRPGIGPERAVALSVTCAVLLSYSLHIEDLAVMLLPFGLLPGFRSAVLSRSMLLAYFALPFLLIMGPTTLVLASLPLLLFAYGAATTGDGSDSGRAGSGL